MGFEPYKFKAPIERKPGEIRFGAFPEGHWKVVWIGDVDFHSRSRTYSQPSVSVVVVGVGVPNFGQSTEVIVPVAQLFPLALGRYWKDKVRTSEIDAEQIERSIEFDALNAVECQAGVPIGGHFGDEYLLPFSAHKHHKEHTKSWCNRVEISREQFIFPSVEIIRFYFGSSGGLIKNIFSADFSLSRLATKYEMHRGNHAYVELPYGVSAISASDVARIAFDKAAQSSAQLVSRSLMGSKAGAPSAKSYVRATFPFTGKTKMNVRGIPLQGNDYVSRFLVTEILSCGSTFPFDTLEYVSASKAHAQSLSKSLPDSSAPPAVRRSSAQAKDPTVENDEPKASTAPRVVLWDRDVRFPDLLRKPIRRVDHNVPRQVMLSMLPSKPFESAGRGTSSGRGQRIDPVIEVDERWLLEKVRCPVDIWHPYFHLLQHLARQQWVDAISFVRLDPRQGKPHYTKIPEIIDSDGCILPSTLRSNLNGFKRSELSQRMASFANVRNGERISGVMSICPLKMEEPNQLFVWPNHRLTGINALAALAETEVNESSWVRQTLILEHGDRSPDLTNTKVVDEQVIKVKHMLLGL